MALWPGGLLALLIMLVSAVAAARSKYVRTWALLLYYAWRIQSEVSRCKSERDARAVYVMLAKQWAAASLRLWDMMVEVENIEAVPRGTPCLYLCNHQSAFDIPTLIHAVPEAFSFMPKREIRSIPLLGSMLERTGHIFLDRSNPEVALRSMNEVVAPALQDRSFLVFPEGTRSRHGIIPFKKGAFHMAIGAKTLIVPMAIAGADDIGALVGSADKADKIIKIRFGTPLPVDGSEVASELLVRVRKEIIALNKQLEGSGAQPGTEEAHVAQSGNPTKKGLIAGIFKF